MNTLPSILLLLFLTMLLSCKHTPESSDVLVDSTDFIPPSSDSYFPLVKGNMWIYRQDEPWIEWIVVKVVDYKKLGGRWYSEVDEATYFHSGKRVHHYVDYLTFTDSSTVEGICGIDLDTLSIQALSNHLRDWITKRYDFRPQSGRSWQYKFVVIPDSPAIKIPSTSLGRKDSLLFDHRIIHDLFQIETDIGIESRYTETFARGIGCIARRTEMGAYYRLCAYVLN